MNKLAKIEVSDFRIYQSKQTFSFELDGRIANLIVIYAPNGFGKTSFFDAVEWAYSGKIGRFERDNILAEIERKDYASGDQILLTNRKSFREGREGVIKMTMEDGRSITRKVQKRKITNQERYFDYRSGDLSGDLSDVQLTKLARTHLLTQDQIDAFLRFTTPEQKFRALSEFWDEGDTAIRTYKNLGGYIRVVQNAKSALLDRRAANEKEIKALLNTAENVNRVNEGLAQLSAQSVLDFKAERITHPVSEEIYRSLQELAATFFKKAERSLEFANTKRARLNELTVKQVDFSNSKIIHTERTVELRSLEKLEKLYTDLAKLINDRAIAQKALSGHNNFIGELKRLLVLWPEYQLILERTALQRQEINSLLSQNEPQISKAGIFAATVQNMERHLERLAERIIELQKDADGIMDLHRLFLNWIKDSQTFRLSDEEINNKLAKNQAARQKLTDEQAYYERFFQHNDLSLLANTTEAELKKLIEAVDLASIAVKSIEADLQQYRDRFEKSGTLVENLDRILIWGESYVAETNADHCPLCKTGFEDVNALLGQIRSEKIELVSIEKQQETIIGLEGQLEVRQQELTANREAVIAYLQLRRQICEENITVYQSQRHGLLQEQLDIKAQIEFANKQLATIREQLAGHFSSDAVIEDQNPEMVKAALEKEITDIKDKADRLTALISLKRAAKEQAENELAANRNRLTSLMNAVELNESAKSFTDTRELLDLLRIPLDENEPLIRQRLQTEQLSANGEDAKITLFNTRVLEVTEEVKALPLKYGEIQIPGRKVELENELRSLGLELDDYLKLYTETLDNATIDLTVLPGFVEKNGEYINRLSADIVRLEQLTAQIELISENITKQKLEIDIAGIDSQLPELYAAELKLDKAQKVATEYIDKEINGYFNKEVINQIYSRIEPHPDLNVVEFIPEVTGKTLMLDVKASGDSDAVNPVLYLSAGQLNVVSLSIFLAKIFETGEEVVSTVFMDDPVQNLSDINILSFTDLIRSMVVNYDKQVVISTHDEHFYQLIQHKMPSSDFDAKYIELENFGVVKNSL